MNISTNAVQKCLREPEATAHSERTQRPCRSDSDCIDPGAGRVPLRPPARWRLVLQAPWHGGLTRLVSLARLVPLACAGVLTTSLPAAAQNADPAPAPEQSPAPAPAAAEPSPAAPAAEQGAEAAAPAADQSAEAAPGQIDDVNDYVEAEGTEEVVVTGFQKSLGKALERKQRTTAQVDAIVADDIADFPDLNLAEALQRIPGVAITRTNGEGSQITVRGLSGLYTRVRINGMEARAAVGNNNGRNFDFSIFASELFNSVVVHKTASADLDEGSLGAVVDLNTARAFNYKEGLTFLAGATGAYNDLSGTVRPRLTGLVAYRDPAGVWGATLSAAYSASRNDVNSTDTVRWQKGPFRSVDGTVCMDNPMDPACAEVNDAQHPRIPRYGQQINPSSRLGLTGGFQLRPTDTTEIRLDGLYAAYNTTTDLKYLETLFRGNEGGFDISSYTLKAFPDRYGTGNDSLIAANVDNAWVRSERNRIELKTNFYQVSLGLDQRFTDSFYLSALGGTTRSHGKQPHDATVAYDIRNYNGFRFDLSNDQYPLLAYNGADVTDATQYTATDLRDRHIQTTSGFDTGELDLHYDIVDQLKLAAGVNYKRATLDTKGQNRDGGICGLKLYDCDTNDDMTDDLLGAPGDPALSDTVHYSGKVGAGSNTTWTTPSIDKWFQSLGYYEKVPLTLDMNNTYKVTEKNLGFYLQTKGEIQLGEGEMRFLYDAGARYVQTDQSSSGYNSGVYVTVDRPTYTDFLPSANAALWLTNEMVVRLAAAKVMARPALANLSPGGTVDSFNYTVNFQNPNLNPTRATSLDAAFEWYFADNSMFAIAGFWKKIDSFPIRQSHTGTFASTGLPQSVIRPTSPADLSPDKEGTCGDPAGCWDISQLTDGPGSKVKGFEVGFQAPFSAFYGGLPPVIRGMGIIANYTFVDSKANYQFQGNTITERLIGLSNGSYNATLYYEDSKFGARVSLAHRSDYLTDGPDRTGNLWEFVEPATQVDFASNYSVTKQFKLSLEALNLLDTPYATKVDVDAERRVLYNHTGRTILLGARYSY
jgi:iron complex outermembrane receptor protein